MEFRTVCLGTHPPSSQIAGHLNKAPVEIQPVSVYWVWQVTGSTVTGFSGFKRAQRRPGACEGQPVPQGLPAFTGRPMVLSVTPTLGPHGCASTMQTQSSPSSQLLDCTFRGGGGGHCSEGLQKPGWGAGADAHGRNLSGELPPSRCHRCPRDTEPHFQEHGGRC